MHFLRRRTEHDGVLFFEPRQGRLQLLLLHVGVARLKGFLLGATAAELVQHVLDVAVVPFVFATVAAAIVERARFFRDTRNHTVVAVCSVHGFGNSKSVLVFFVVKEGGV